MTETETFIPDQGDTRRLRDALGAFATGVCVVTTQDGTGPLGITANSFSSLSLDPPLVLWSPARASRRFAAFAAAQHFAIHVLAEDQFALGRHFALHGQDFALPGVTFSPENVPLLPGCLACFECRQEAVHEGGDHALIIGRVLRAASRAGAPLVFSGGRYGGFLAAAG
ncbi:flavin reductase family protein [Pararhodobacter sp.]|uniref:flavin reductase family protein n=1 Tax=Pararhodobacter sp. TaxID=2127056 RepID=UPI002FDDBDDF